MALHNNRIITLKDIARRTGFSINTVSRVMNNRDNIALDTREKIMSVAAEMGYVKNSLAGSLRSGTSGTIAVIISDVSNPLFGNLVKTIDSVLREYNYCTFVMNTDENEELEKAAVYLAISKKVDGIILCPTQQNRAAIDLIVANNIPYVLMGRTFDNPNDTSVVWDDWQGGYLATNHLILKGHRSILLLNAPEYISSAQKRLAGYREALKKNNIEFDPRLVKQCNLIHSNVSSLVSRQWCDGPKFTAVFAFNDLIAFETIQVLTDLGYYVPENIAVIGFDNLQSRLPLPCPLTTVSTPKAKMAQKVAELLIDKITEESKTHEKCIVLDTSIVVRQST